MIFLDCLSNLKAGDEASLWTNFFPEVRVDSSRAIEGQTPVRSDLRATMTVPLTKAGVFPYFWFKNMKEKALSVSRSLLLIMSLKDLTIWVMSLSGLDRSLISKYAMVFPAKVM